MAENHSDTPTNLAENEDSSSDKLSDNEFMITDGQTETVVVYLDRAEVSRSFQTKVKKGENEIKFKGLSECVDKDSIRVEGRGPATIVEVAFQTKYLTPHEQNSSQEKDSSKIRKNLDDARKKKDVLQMKSLRLEKQRSVLDGFANNAMKGSGLQPHEGSTNPSFLSKDNLVGMTAFLDLFDRQAGRVDDSLHNLKTEQGLNDGLISSLEKTLRELNVGQTRKESRELVILLEALGVAEVTLCVTYVVSKASWSPKYDVRVYSAEHQLKIQYYGVIQQATGEDWLEAKLCLSTAMPSVGGLLPTLGTQKLSFKPRIVVPRKARFGSFSPAMPRMAANSPPMMLQSYALEAESVEMAEPPPMMDIMTSEVKESITTTMYEIARRSTIPCDNVGHKVTVAIIDLVPTFEYQSVPKTSPNAFLKAKVKNVSPYALLAGPSNVFLDNNFIAKSSLKAVSPSEDFTCSLGNDPTIKIDYKPLVKYREQSGIISKTTCMTYRQVIEVKNTHKETVKILLSDQLPLSTEEKIKVHLQEPVIKHPEKYDVTKPIRLNPSNNVEWDLEIVAGDTREVILKYTIEHPSTEQVETEVTTHNSSTDC